MDIFSLGITMVGAITVICFLFGQAVKATGLDNKWIPVVCGVVGGISGLAGFYLPMADFPAQDPLTALAVGIVSGLAATGANQVYKQFTNSKEG